MTVAADAAAASSVFSSSDLCVKIVIIPTLA